MTLQDYLKIFRHSWLVIVACTLVAAAVMWFVTPASTDTTAKVGSYTATATLLVGADEEGEPGRVDGRIPLYLTTGEIPKRAAEAVGYEGDPAAAGLRAHGDAGLPGAGPDRLRHRLRRRPGRRRGQRLRGRDRRLLRGGRQAGHRRREAVRPPGGHPHPERVARWRVRRAAGPRTAHGDRGAAGAAAGLALALVLDRLDSRLRSREEIHAALRMPIIAEIPRLARAQRGRAGDRGRGGPAERLRGRVPCGAHGPDAHPEPAGSRGVHAPTVAGGDPRRRAVGPGSSSSPRRTQSEGKTTSVANLAASFAETGQRVLVLDADLRSPDTHNLFDVPQGAGISDYLSEPGDASLEALIRPTSVPGVRIITAGTRLAHPASLASRMGHLLAEAREMADIVLIDTAPLLAASDVFDILPMVDTVLLVVRSGRLTETVRQPGCRAARPLPGACRRRHPRRGQRRSGRTPTATATGRGQPSRSEGRRRRPRRRPRRRGEPASRNRASPCPQAPARSRTCFSKASRCNPREPRSRRARRTSSA